MNGYTIIDRKDDEDAEIITESDGRVLFAYITL